MQILAIVVFLLAGCATGYQPKGLTGGYSETRLGERAFEVSFEGNGYTNQLAARRGALHRAAELAVQLGYFGFWVASQNASVATSVYSQPVSCVSGNCSGGDATMIQKPTATITVTMVTWPEAQQPSPGIVVYDARLILSQPTY